MIQPAQDLTLTTEPRPRRIGRRLGVTAALALAGGSAFLTWWLTTLNGLPDIGDPFDVASFIDRRVPDDENAFLLYREAVKRLPPGPSGDVSFEWETAGEAEKGWLERSREALGVWRRGTERPKAFYLPAGSITIATTLPVMDRIRWLMRLAKLEASRLEAEGDLEGAWGWYRAIFRCSRQIGHHGTAVERFAGIQMHALAARQLMRWAKDPRVTPALLRRALDAVIADDAETSPLSDTLKVEYLTFLKTYDDPDLVRKCLNDEDTAGADHHPWFARDPGVFGVSKAFLREPERSRRVTRLVYANLLSVCDLPARSRPPVVCSLPNLTGRGGTPTLLVNLYAVDASMPESARALPPAKILEWYQSTLYARHLTPALINIMKAVDTERVTQANLVIALANRLYEVERGKPPETFEELVGPYLKALPEGYHRDQ